MKTYLFYNSLVLTFIVLGIGRSSAQVHVSVNIGQPAYASPAPVEVRYYYLPEVEAYYCVPQRVYYYRDRGRWTSGRYLPGYRNYNVYNVRRIEINESRPYLRHDYYRSRYRGRIAYVEHGYPGYKGRGWDKHTHKDRGRH